jgi:peptidoglycan/xylan/chitin deacetylase (PgdA/CDA1 family)
VARAGTIYLMYHELQLPGRKLCQNDNSYVHYVVEQCRFRAQLARLKESGFRGMAVGEALFNSDREQPGVAITFDDGCESDLLAAAPLLREAGFNATFYVVVRYLGVRGYLSLSQLKELADLDFEVGSHSINHAHLTDLSPQRLRAELFESKNQLEQVLGRPVEHFSCPFGSWSPDVARVAGEAGYRSVATSRVGINSETADRFRLARLVVMRGTTMLEFDRLCKGSGLLERRAKAAILSGTRHLFGNEIYEKIRSAFRS